MRYLQAFWGRDTFSQDTDLLLSDLTMRNGPSVKSRSNTMLNENRPVHTEEIVSSHTGKSTTKSFSGWRFTLILSVLLGISIFGFNLGVTIWAFTNFPIVQGVATFHQGSCSRTQSSVTWLHLAINILSTLLLGASNFCMQILCAPTRQEVDAAHARRKWLSIGVPSLKNLLYVDRKKSALWLLLGCSSIPLHLLWNSAVVTTLTANEYVFSAVTEGFVGGADWNTTLDLNPYPSVAESILESYSNHSLVNMTVAGCIKAYGLNFNSDYGDVVLVYDAEVGNNNSLLIQGLNEATAYAGKFAGPLLAGGGGWMCGGPYCDFGELSRKNSTHWNPWSGLDLGEYTLVRSTPAKVSYYIEGNVKYCLAVKVDRLCRLGISPSILITVLVCNAIKIICFILTFWVGGSMHPLVTNGEAVESFLLRPDTSLKGRCLVSKVDVTRNKHFWSEEPLPLQWRRKRWRWAAGATKGFWLATFIPYGILYCLVVNPLFTNFPTALCASLSRSSPYVLETRFGRAVIGQLLMVALEKPVPKTSLGMVSMVLYHQLQHPYSPTHRKFWYHTFISPIMASLLPC